MNKKQEAASITDEQLQEFTRIYRDKYGIQLSPETALDSALMLLGLVRNIYRQHILN